MPRRRSIPVYRDGKVHVMAKKCSDCIFRAGNLMHLSPGRVRDMVEACVREDGSIPCHQRMDTRAPAVCRGLYDSRRVALLQVAERLGVVVFDE